MKRSAARFFVLVMASIAGMALLGVAAFMAALRAPPWVWPPSEMPVLLVPAVIAAMVGFLSMPFVVAFLANTRLHQSIPLVYGASFLITVTYALLVPIGFVITSAIPAFLSVILFSRWCAHRYGLPKPPGRCEKCDYNLTGCKEPGCPECGWGRGGAAL